MRSRPVRSGSSQSSPWPTSLPDGTPAHGAGQPSQARCRGIRRAARRCQCVASILRIRDVRLIVGAVGLSAAGDTVLWVLLALHVGQASGSALATSALFICLWGPVVLLGGVAGRIVDRRENRRLLIAVSLAQAAVVVAMAFASGSLPVLLALCVLLGAGAAVSSPAEFALVPAAAGEDRVAEANGHVEAARYLGMTAGPLLGGALAAAGLTRAGLLLDAASFASVAAAGMALHARRAPAHAGPSGARRERRACLAILRRDRWLAAGALLGIALQGAGMLGAAVGATMALALAGFLVGGAAHGVKNVLLRTLIHESVPDAMRGRAFAAYNAARNGAEMGALVAGGVLVGLAGPQIALGVAGAVPLAIALGALALL